MRAASQLIVTQSLTSLRTARLDLYSQRLEDLEARVGMDRDPQVMHYIRPIPEDVETSRAEIRGRILGTSGPPGPAIPSPPGSRG